MILRAPAEKAKITTFVEETENGCGILIKYGGSRFTYEKHEARKIYEQLGKLIKKWDGELK